MRKIFTSVALVLSGFAAIAQQDPQFSQNMWNRLATNPGFAGSNGTVCATLLGRQQWGGFIMDPTGKTSSNGVPKSILLSVDAPVKALHGGLGATIISDQIGFEKNLFVKLAYAYRLPLGPGMLGLGVEAGMLNKSIGADWTVPDAGTTAADDAAIPRGSSDIAPDFGLGAYYHTPQMYVGISTTHLTTTELKETQFKFSRHYYVTAGYNKMIGQDLELRPSVFVKSDAASTQLDLNMNVMFRNMFWGGLSYRLQDAIVPMVGYQQVLTNGSSFRIGYAYDVTTSDINRNTHEIMLGYCLKMPDKVAVQRKKTVRFL